MSSQWISLSRCLVPALMAMVISPLSAAITVGRGPQIGTDSGGNTYYEEFQDWAPSDVKALSPVGNVNGRYNFSDGFDDSRDLSAFYYRSEGSRVYFRADFYDLALGAESSNLDLYVAINTGTTTAGTATYLPDFTDVQVSESNSGQTGGWNLCLSIYSNAYYNVYDGSYNVILGRSGGAQTGTYAGSFVGDSNGGPYFNRELDGVEFGIEKSVLYAAGWNGTTPLKFWVATARDGTNGGSGEITGGSGSTSDITDTFKDSDRGFGDGVINGFISSTDTVGRAKYASIGHANQSLNKAGDLVTHVFEVNAFNTGFVRALDTHEIFKVPFNMHFSGTLLTGLAWAETARSNATEIKQDGPLFLQRVKRLLDPNQTSVPLSLIGGVYSEHIMPYFEGPVNQKSMDLFEEISLQLFGIGAADMKVMHTPERVIRSQPTGGAGPLTGLTFADISATTYVATYIDEVTHYHHWFDSANSTWSGNGGSGDAPAQHKIQKINGVYCFLINDREDQGKFANTDEGASLDVRYSMSDKAIQADQAQITVVFDDWEALAGKSFDPFGGNLTANNNQMQYQRTIRWLANHQWVEIVNLKDVLDRAVNTGHPQYNANWVIDRGTRTNLPIETYEWLKHAAEGAYHNWYYNNNNSVLGNEQDFYNLVPVLLGRQGDYRIRVNGSNVPLTNFINAAAQANRSAEANAQDTAMGATFLPSGKKLGDLNTSNTLLHDAYVDLVTAPENNLKRLGWYQFSSMIYETAWHEEDNGAYQNTNYQSPFPIPDTSWDGMNEWCTRLNNHVRDVGYTAYAARWAEQVRTGSQTAATIATSLDLDQDGQVEYVLRNNKALAIFQRHGGRMLHAFHYHPTAGPISVIGSPASNPSEPGEEERTGSQANRCTALKDMNTGAYADAEYTVLVGTPNARSIRLTSPDGKIQKTVTLPDGTARFDVAYTVDNSLGALFTRIGVSPNNLNLIWSGQSALSTASGSSPSFYAVLNNAGSNGGVWITMNAGVSRNTSPSNAGYRNRNLALTEEIEVSGSGSYSFGIAFEAGSVPVYLRGVELE